MAPAEAAGEHTAGQAVRARTIHKARVPGWGVVGDQAVWPKVERLSQGLTASAGALDRSSSTSAAHRPAKLKFLLTWCKFRCGVRQIA